MRKGLYISVYLSLEQEYINEYFKINIMNSLKCFQFLIFLLILLSCQSKEKMANETLWTDMYNITWEQPSLNASESMPLGGGDIGCNVWVESGDILFYMQKSGSFSENGEYLKLGRVRLRLTPNPFAGVTGFQQSLRLEDGSILISTGEEGKESVHIKMWVDIFTQSIHFDLHSDKKIAMEAFYENWRTEDRELANEKRGRFGCFGMEGYPGEVIKKKDQITFSENGILFYHRNAENTLSPDVMIEQQKLTEYKDEICNTISNLTFGGFMFGDNLVAGDVTEGRYCNTDFKAWSLKSKETSNNYHLQIVTHREQTPDMNQWTTRLKEKVALADKEKGNPEKNAEWWWQFWNQSWIITDPARKDTGNLWEVGRNYQLFRYQLGCNMYGEYPSKFNGGNLTFDPGYVDPKMEHDPDWRQWGGDVFTAQNQRLLFWPMLKSGDYDGMIAQFNLYKRGLRGAQLKVREYFGHNGAVYCEYANDAGLDFGAGWGWQGSKMRQRGKELPFGSPEIKAVNTYFEPVEQGVMANGSISYHWESQVEHAYMLLEYNRFTGRNIDEYMPFIKNALIFFDEHYQKRQQMRDGKTLDENGKLVFFPSTSCESYRGAKNPADLVSGIRSCLESLLVLRSDSVSDEDRAYFSAYLERLPDLYYDVIEGDTVVKPAESYIKYQNVECPQFYPLFPFNRYDINSSEIPVFRNTWKHGNFPKNMVISWHQDGIFYARMGMVEEAYQYNKQKLKDSERRFPTFWGPGHDWVPDHNWGGSGMIGLQEMLLQTIGNKIHVLPCWPKDKDVCFKLHAPENTTVEVEYKNGKVQKLEVLPESRMKNVELFLE